MENKILTPEFLEEKAKESFERVKKWSAIYKTWNDVQKSKEDCKGAVWAAINYFRNNYPTNTATYAVQVGDNQFLVMGWLVYNVVGPYHYSK